MSNHPKFSDFAKEQGPLEGDKVKISDILDKEILVTGYDTKQSRYSKNKSGLYLTLQFKETEEAKPKIFFTGSDVLIDQIERYKDNVPFWTTIQKINRYYTLS